MGIFPDGDRRDEQVFGLGEGKILQRVDREINPAGEKLFFDLPDKPSPPSPQGREIAGEPAPLGLTRRVSRAGWGGAAEVLESGHRARAQGSRLPRPPR